MSENMFQITDANFDAEVVKSALPVLADFWAEWCGPCRMMNPVLSEAASLYKGRLRIGKCNIDENPETPTKFGVMNIPTMIIFKNGAEVERLVGATSKVDLQRRHDRFLAG